MVSKKKSKVIVKKFKANSVKVAPSKKKIVAKSNVSVNKIVAKSKLSTKKAISNKIAAVVVPKLSKAEIKEAKLKIKLDEKTAADKITKKLYEEREKLEMENLKQVLSDSYARQMLIELAGENALEIVRNFYGNLSDEELSKTLKLKISDVRATLNRLHCEGLVTYLREKDSETGWYSYSWQLNKPRIEEWVGEKVKARYPAFDDASGDHYFCPSCGAQNTMLALSEAQDSSFKCPKCSSALEYFDREKTEEIMGMKSKVR
ncbi:MAG: hypothetical protein Q7S22_05885 [Candidatus Micrarchaeota archaeon]|nr:hypothetical protein [Candidatus Micrarchaeota archaeon]